jgi:hypothetical protein
MSSAAPAPNSKLPICFKLILQLYHTAHNDNGVQDQRLWFHTLQPWPVYIVAASRKSQSDLTQPL